MVTSLEASEKDRICIACLWLYCYTSEQTERLRVSFLSYQAEEKDYVPEEPERRRVSSALVDEAEKEEAAGCSGAPAQAEKEAECRHVSEKEVECPDHSPEEAEEEAGPDSPEEEEEAEESSSEGG